MLRSNTRISLNILQNINEHYIATFLSDNTYLAYIIDMIKQEYCMYSFDWYDDLDSSPHNHSLIKISSSSVNNNTGVVYFWFTLFASFDV